MFVGLVRALRAHQWVKNLFVLAPLVFARELLNVPMALRASAAFVLFCLASSTVYILNDLADVESDRAHPVKRNRPIPSGLVPERVARRAAVVLGCVSVGAGFLVDVMFGVAVTSYLVLNLAYSSYLKRVAYVDVMCITAGFELRVLGGAYAAAVPASAYLIVVTFLLASFLGFGKRMHELVQGEKAVSQRSVLRQYNKKTLTVLLFITGLLTVGTYAVYTLDHHTRAMFGSDYLVGTTVFTAFGVLRFLHLVRNRPDAESPTDQMLRDWPFLANLGLWIVAVIATIYVNSLIAK